MGDSHSLFEIGTQHLPNLCRNPFWDESNAAYYWYYPLSNWCSIWVSICCFPCLWTGAPVKKRSGDSPFHFGIAKNIGQIPHLCREISQVGIVHGQFIGRLASSMAQHQNQVSSRNSYQKVGKNATALWFIVRFSSILMMSWWPKSKHTVSCFVSIPHWPLWRWVKHVV